MHIKLLHTKLYTFKRPFSLCLALQMIIFFSRVTNFVEMLTKCWLVILIRILKYSYPLQTFNTSVILVFREDNYLI